MSKIMNNILLLRLPFFIVSHAFFSYICSVIYGRDAAIEAYLLILPFYSLFFLDEAIKKKSLRIVTQLACILVWITAAYTVFGGPGGNNLFPPFCVVCALYLFYFLVTSPYQYERYKFVNSIGLCFIFFIICGSYLRIEAARIFFIDGVIITVFNLLCAHISMINHFVDSYTCRGKSKKTITALLNRNYRFMAMAALLITMLGITANIVFHPVPDSPMEATINEDFILPESSANEMQSADVEMSYETIIEETEEIAQRTIKDTEPFVYARMVIAVLLAALIPVIIFLLIKANIKRRIDRADFKDFEEDSEEGYEFDMRKKKGIRLIEHGVNRTIRRMFYKKVNEHRRRGLNVKRSHTAREISDTISQTENITALGNAYQKARYSGKEVERSELGKI